MQCFLKVFVLGRGGIHRLFEQLYVLFFALADHDTSLHALTLTAHQNKGSTKTQWQLESMWIRQGPGTCWKVGVTFKLFKSWYWPLLASKFYFCIVFILLFNMKKRQHFVPGSILFPKHKIIFKLHFKHNTQRSTKAHGLFNQKINRLLFIHL